MNMYVSQSTGCVTIETAVHISLSISVIDILIITQFDYYVSLTRLVHEYVLSFATIAWRVHWIDVRVDPNKSSIWRPRVESSRFPLTQSTRRRMLKLEVSCFLPSRVKSFWFQVGDLQSTWGHFGTKFGRTVSPKCILWCQISAVPLFDA